MSVSSSLYQALYHTALLAVVLLTLARYATAGSRGVGAFNRLMLWPTALIVVLFMGLRPADAGDMWSYARTFEAYRTGAVLTLREDYVFYLLAAACARVMDARAWFLVVAALYSGALIAAFKLAHDDSVVFPAYLFSVASLGFWNYGTNTIRAGLATSLVVLGFACRRRKGLMTAVLALAIGVHKSALLPVAAFAATFVCRRPALYLLGYGAAIAASLETGDRFQRAVAGARLFQDDRLSTFLTGAADPRLFSATGFRWDFLLYSLLPAAVGAYYIFRRRFRDPFYEQLYATYLAANSFWVLSIRASFSDRFAYLSWFLMPWLLVYPLLERRLFRRHWLATGGLAGAYFSFTYLMNAVLVWGRP